MRNFLYQCTKCHNGFTVEEWDKETLTLLPNRKARRDYINFNNPNSTHIKRNTIYKCPSCGEMIRRTFIKETGIDDSEIVK